MGIYQLKNAMTISLASNMANTLEACQFIKILFLHFLLAFFQCVDSESKGFSLKLIPWDSPKSPFYQPNLTPSQKIHMMTMSSKARAIFPTPTNETFYTKAIQIPIRNRALQYSVNIKIGSPGTWVPLLLDTRSGLIWKQCGQSSRSLPCQHRMCLKDNNLCKCINGKCVCSVNNGIKGRYTNQIEAKLSFDSFTLPMNNSHSSDFTIIFGCSSSGILGLGKSPLSLVSQLRNTVHGRYSYCLHEAGGYLQFGDDIPQINHEAITTKLLPSNSSHDLLLDLRGVSVGKTRVRLSLWSYKEAVAIDTGSPYTVLKKEVYDKVIRAFEKYYNGRLERVNGRSHGGLHLCYRYKRGFTSYAGITFHLNGADYVISSGNLYVIPENGIVCIGLVSGERTVLGALQQRHMRFIFNLNDNLLTFVDENCLKDR